MAPNAGRRRTDKGAGASLNPPLHIRICGRGFSEADIDPMRALIAHKDLPLKRRALSWPLSEALDWRKPYGDLLHNYTTVDHDELAGHVVGVVRT